MIIFKNTCLRLKQIPTQYLPTEFSICRYLGFQLCMFLCYYYFMKNTMLKIGKNLNVLHYNNVGMVYFVHYVGCLENICIRQLIAYYLIISRLSSQSSQIAINQLESISAIFDGKSISQKNYL